MGYPIYFPSPAHSSQGMQGLTAKRRIQQRPIPPRIRIPEDDEVNQAELEHGEWRTETYTHPHYPHAPRRVDIYEGYGEGLVDQMQSVDGTGGGNAAAAFTPIPPHRWSTSPTPPPPSMAAQPLTSRSRSFHPNLVPSTSHIVYPPTWEDDEDNSEEGNGVPLTRAIWSDWRGEDARAPVTSTPILQHEGLSDHRFFSGEYSPRFSSSPPQHSGLSGVRGGGGGGGTAGEGAVEVMEWMESGTNSSPPFPGRVGISTTSSPDLPVIHPAIQARHDQEAAAMQAAYTGWIRQAQSRRERFQRLMDEQTARLQRLQRHSQRFTSQGTHP